MSDLRLYLICPPRQYSSYLTQHFLKDLQTNFDELLARNSISLKEDRSNSSLLTLCIATSQKRSKKTRINYKHLSHAFFS